MAHSTNLFFIIYPPFYLSTFRKGSHGKQQQISKETSIFDDVTYPYTKSTITNF